MDLKQKKVVPSAEQVRLLRESLQHDPDKGITAAQDACALALHTSRRAWQQWERGERSMHPAFWELAQLKLGKGDTHK